MPKERSRRAPGHDFTVETAGEGGGVFAPTRVRAKQSNINFNALGAFTNKVLTDKKAKMDELMYQRGITAAHTGTMTEEELDDVAFTKGLNSQQGVNDAIRANTQLQDSLQEELQNHKDSGTLGDFDIEAYSAEFLGEFQQHDSLEYLKGFNSRLGAVQSAARSRFESFMAAAEDEQIMNTAKDTIRVSLDASKDTPAEEISTEVFKEINRKFRDENGLNRDESHQAFFEEVLVAADAGNLNGAKAAGEWLKAQGKGVSGKYGAKIDKAIRMAEVRQAREQAKGTERTELEKFRVRRGLAATLGTDDFSIASLETAIAHDFLTDDQALSLENQHADILEKQRLEAEFRAQVNYIKSNPEVMNYITEPKVQKGVIKALEADYRGLNRVLVSYGQQYESALSSGDEDTVAALDAELGRQLTEAKGLFQVSQEMGHTPEALKRLTDSAAAGAPQFRHVARIVKALESVEGVQPFAGMNTNKLADIQSFNMLTDAYGWSPVEAEEMLLKQKDIPMSEIAASLRASDGNELVMKAIDELTGEQVQVQYPWYKNDIETEVPRSPFLQEAIKDLSLIYHASGLEASAAVDAAKKRFLETHAPVGGAWISTKGMPRQFPVAYDKFVERNLPGYNSDDFIISPNRDLQGSFSLIRKSDGQPIRRKNNEMFVFSYLEFSRYLQDQSGEDEQTAFTAAQSQASDAVAARTRTLELVDKQLEIEEKLRSYGSNR